MDFVVDLRGKIPSVRADEEIEQDTVSKHPPVNKLVDQAAVALPAMVLAGLGAVVDRPDLLELGRVEATGR